MKLALLIALSIPFAAPALAQNDKFAFISNKGIDHSGFCAAANPCNSIAVALFNSTNGVTIGFEDAYDGGTPTISQSATIDGAGPSVLFSDVTITAPVGETVNLRNVAVSGSVVITGGAEVNLRNVTVGYRPGSGETTGISINSNTHLEDVTITGPFTYGVFIAPAAGNVPNVTMKNVTVSGTTGYGVVMTGGILSMRDSVVKDGSGNGVSITGDGNGHGGTAMIERTEISFNSVGLVADGASGSSLVRLSNSVITGNATGIVTAGGGQIISFRTNMLAGNTTDGSTPFSLSPK